MTFDLLDYQEVATITTHTDTHSGIDWLQIPDQVVLITLSNMSL